MRTQRRFSRYKSFSVLVLSMLIIEKRTAELTLISHVFSPEVKFYHVNAFSDDDTSNAEKRYIPVIVGKDMLKNMMDGLVGYVLDGNSSCHAMVE